MGRPAVIIDMGDNEWAELQRDIDETSSPQEDYYDKADRLRDERKGTDDDD